MKRLSIFICSIAALTFASAANAQSNNQPDLSRVQTHLRAADHGPDVSFGLGLGPNFSSFSVKGDIEASGSTEFQIKGFLDWRLADMWILQTGLRYNSYGEHATSGDAEASLHVRYLEIPVLVKPMIDAGGWYPYLLFGPNFGFKVSEGVDASEGGNHVSVSTSNAKTFNFALDFGIGAEVPIMPNLRGFAEFEYALGLTNIANNDPGVDDSAKTRGPMLTFGVVAGF